MCGGEELEGKEIVAENAAQLIADYTRGEVQKKIAQGELEVAKINNKTDKEVAELDAKTAEVTELPMFLVDEVIATKCGRPDWAGKEILASNVARMFVEHSKAEVDAMRAKASLEVAQAMSDSNKDVYAAEGKAAKSLRDRRAFELAKRQIDVYRSMVSNDKVSFMGSDDASMLPNMVTGTCVWWWWWWLCLFFFCFFFVVQSFVLCVRDQLKRKFYFFSLFFFFFFFFI